jgi:FKBP-type peptidyl-prolyl cis-trans isomerase FklB
MMMKSWLLVAVLLASFAAGNTTKEGRAYLDANAQAEGVTETSSGLQYRVISSGPIDGSASPGLNDPCVCQYSGALIDGTQFDSGTASFAPSQVISGWTEALQLMHQGDAWELTIPSELAYGDAGSKPRIPGGAVLVFQLTLLQVGQRTAVVDAVNFLSGPTFTVVLFAAILLLVLAGAAYSYWTGSTSTSATITRKLGGGGLKYKAMPVRDAAASLS